MFRLPELVKTCAVLLARSNGDLCHTTLGIFVSDCRRSDNLNYVIPGIGIFNCQKYGNLCCFYSGNCCVRLPKTVVTCDMLLQEL